ncbi:rhodanese-like domain-containing protein [Carnobacterium sp. CS13]|uniref:rhodanese-like domain-containing protein n=1 Tax=Carnobacterium sp. CS13 TaxID=2800128 RepID=UPI0019135B76|nr:rhodanese-like domain-containing protein [Carnobacterium sp. CS13]QQP69346.1 rhodanese-like domain-containing protein [Carnobacterium sp. CS13]
MYKSISIPEFEQKWNKASLPLIDVREDHEFSAGHLKEAIHIPLNDLPENLDSLDKNKEYYIMCHSGGRSATASHYLADAGYQVVNVMGGISAWKGEKI